MLFFMNYSLVLPGLRLEKAFYCIAFIILSFSFCYKSLSQITQSHVWIGRLHTIYPIKNSIASVFFFLFEYCDLERYFVSFEPPCYGNTTYEPWLSELINLVSSRINVRYMVPVGPLRCLPMISSAKSGFSVSAL